MIVIYYVNKCRSVREVIGSMGTIISGAYGKELFFVQKCIMDNILFLYYTVVEVNYN